MPISVQQTLPRINYSGYAPTIAEEPVGALGTLGAAFRLENDVVNLIQYASRGDFNPDPEFDPMSRVKTSQFFNLQPQSFIGVQSDAEWNFMEAKIAKELKDRAILEAGGIGGIAAAMAAGILSPTVLIPVGNAATAGRVTTAAAKTAAMTAFGVGVQEGILHMNQETRTVAESAFAVGGGAVLGGLLGAGIRYLDPLDMDRVANDMVTAPTKQAILPLNTFGGPPQGLSAQAATPEEMASYVNTRFTDPGPIAPGISSLIPGVETNPAVKNTLNFSWMGKITRLMASPREGARAWAAEFGNAGLYTEGALQGRVAPEDGVLEHVVGSYMGKFALTHERTKELYTDWYLSQGKTLGTLGSRANFSSMREFSEAVGNEMFQVIQGTAGNVAPQVRKAAELYINDLFLPVVKEAHNVGLPPFNRLGSSEESIRMALEIVTQKISRLKLGGDYNVAREILAENAIEKLRAAKLKAEELSLKDAERGLVADLIAGKAPRAVDGLTDNPKIMLAKLDDEEILEVAQDIADELMRKHMANGRRHAPVDILQAIGEKEAKYIYVNPTRTWSNGRTWSEFLEQDAEILGRSFSRSIGPDIELYRRFKVNFQSDEPFDLSKKKFTKIPQVKRFMEEMDIARQDMLKIADPEKRAKVGQKLAKEEADFVRDTNAMIGMLRHTYGAPDDPMAVGYRAGKALLQLNTMRLMGSVVLSALPDLARFVLKYGMMSTMKNGLKPLLTDLKGFRAVTKEMRYAGAGLELALHGRANAMFGLFEESDMGGMFIERAMQQGTNMMGKVAAFDYWNTGLKNFAGNIANAEIMMISEKAAAGQTLTPREVRFLGGLSIRQEDAAAMMRLIQRRGGTQMENGVWLPNTEDWLKVPDEEVTARAEEMLAAYKRDKPKSTATIKSKSPDGKLTYEQAARREILRESSRLLRVYQSALKQAVDDTIITPGLELPNWTQGSMFGRLMAQFRSFTFSSTFKAVLAASQEARAGNMAPIATGTMFSLALGVLSYYIWAKTVGGNTQARMENEFEAALNGDDEAWARIADEAITRSGLLGVVAEAQKFGERTPGLDKFATLAGTPTAKSPYLNPVTEMIGPWLSALNNAGRIAVTAADPTSETFRKAKQLMPYQNVFYLRRMFDAMNESAMDAAGVSYR